MQLQNATRDFSAMTTSEQNAQQIAANTQAIAGLNEAINFLVTEFIRPNVQQHLQSVERLERVESIIESIAKSLEKTKAQQQINAKQIAQNSEGITQYRQLLEETRQLVAKNGSDIAQSSARHDKEMTALREMQAQTDERIEVNRQQILDNAVQVNALAETSRTQLAGIISNGRRIDRLEQQAS